MIGENPIKTNKAKAEDQIIIYYATNAAAAAAVSLVSLPTRRAIVGGLPITPAFKSPVLSAGTQL